MGGHPIAVPARQHASVPAPLQKHPRPDSRRGGERARGVRNEFRVPGPRREPSSARHLGHLKRLLPYAGRYAWVLGAALAGLLVTRLADALVPQFVKTAIDSLVDDGLEPNLAMPALAILAIVAARFAIYVLSRRVLRRISISIAYDLRKRLFNHVQYQGPAFFNRFGTGDLMSRAVNDIAMVRMVVSFGWVTIILVAFTLVAGLYFMIDMSPELTAWVVIPLPVVALTAFVMARRMFPYYRDRQEAMADVTAFTQENLNGIRTIQAMAQEEHEIARFRQVGTRYAQKVYRATRFQGFMNLALSVLVPISPVIILFHGGSLVLAGALTLGEFTAFSAYLMMVSGSITSIGWSLSLFTAAAAGTQRIFEVLDTPREVSDAATGTAPAEVRGRLSFEGFRYAHPGAARPTIDGIDLVVHGGETVALLGRVGSGKSTLLKAAARLLDTPPGMLFLDGQDVCDLPLARLREAITLVPQDPFLFSTTLRDNLTYDDPTRRDGEIVDAADAAGLGDTLRELAEGLDTVVGERGITLSGGQKQRATLARGLIRNAPVLLLDDCFSSVDTETEERILGNLKRLRHGRSTLLVSHRVSTARHADRIYVIDNGHVLESGTHAELLAQGGYYADLEAVQSNQDKDRARKSRLLHDLEVDTPVFRTAAGGEA